MQIQLTAQMAKIHEKALLLSQKYRVLESEIIEILIQVDESKLYRNLGRTSLFDYAVKDLNFTESVAYAFIAVARRSKSVPELQVALKEQRLSVAKASRVSPHLTVENANEVIDFAATHSTRETEVEMARLFPREIKKDRVKPYTEDLMEWRLTAPRQVIEKLERVKSILAQKGKSVKADYEAIEAGFDEFLLRHDPVRKAERSLSRAKKNKTCIKTEPRAKKIDPQDIETMDIETTETESKEIESKGTGRSAQLKSKNSPFDSQELCAFGVGENLNVHEPRLRQKSPRRVGPESAQNHGQNERGPVQYTMGGSAAAAKRVPLTAKQKHAVFQRDQGRCTFVDAQGQRCGSDRWVHIHHVKSVSAGGGNEPENLVVLCSAHHNWVHQMSFPIEGQMSWLKAREFTYETLG